MIRKKICMLGAFAVGKTSLVQRFVKSIFKERYFTTLGVKIDKKPLLVDGREVSLILWDLAGEDEFIRLRLSYLRGSAGLILVVDSTRPETLETAIDLQRRVAQEVGDMPFALLLNKADLAEQWCLDPSRIEILVDRGWMVIETSAKTGVGVEAAFQALAAEILKCGS